MKTVSVGSFLKWQNDEGKVVFVRVCGISYVLNMVGVIEKYWVNAGKNNKSFSKPWLAPYEMEKLGAKMVTKEEILDELNK